MAIITLTTDFGVDNYLVAALKGCIHQQVLQPTIIDITHQIAPSDIYETSYQFKGALPYFEKNSHHLILSALFTNKETSLLIIKDGTNYFYLVDNGTAPLLFGEQILVRKIKVDAQFTYTLHNIFKTFAQALQLLIKGTSWEAFTEPYTLQHKGRDIDPILKENSIKAQVIYIDHFKNVVVNLTRDEFEKHRQERKFKIDFFGGSIDSISLNYADVKSGKQLCFFNNAGFLEIAVNGAEAADLFALERTASQDSIYSTITIYFE